MELTEKRLLITGPNGAGKTNLLEAIELLGSLRSHRCSRDSDLIHWNQERALLRALSCEDETLELELRRKGGRQAKRNEKVLSRQFDLIGPLRCVGFSSLDLELVRGQPALRRQWLDRVVQQLEPIYSDLISRYSRLLRQRSQLWRRWRNKPANERDAILDAFDLQMALVSTRIHRRRSRALRHLQPLVAHWQKMISNGKEKLELVYYPGSKLKGEEAEEPWRLDIQDQLLDQRLDEERLGSCRVGPHRDEVGLLLNGLEARRFASSGQQRTLILSLKLAELDLVEQMSGLPPILLLDDVLAELDAKRQLLLLEVAGEKHQCIVTATHLDAFQGEWMRESQLLETKSFSSKGSVG